MKFSVLQEKPSSSVARSWRAVYVSHSFFTLFPPSKEQVLHKPTIYIGLKFKRRSNHASWAAASSILPTLCSCEWGMMGAVLSAGERQHLDDAFVKQAGENQKISPAPCGSPSQNPGAFQMRLPDQQFNQESRIHARNLCVFTYHKLKWNNDLEVFGWF